MQINTRKSNSCKSLGGINNTCYYKKYLYGTETITDWKVGSPIVFQGEYEGVTYRDHGVILENIPYQKLIYSYWSSFSGTEDIPDNYSEVGYILMEQEDHTTTLTWVQKGYVDEEKRAHSENGMNDFLEQLKQIIESN
ncbi:MAG: SRPBCC domain-containing protein [Sphingobacteriia bacterium]|nr:SRPBCC domain-containing protein [Sphingobacteriia bacterium]